MILRKPYAFLIKYFQQIHLVLIALCSFLFYKSITLQTFVRNFIATESYDASLESVHHYTNFWTYFCFIALFLIVLILMTLLRYKKKPWKIYLLIFLEYFLLLCVFLYISSFFDQYDAYSLMTSIMAGRDLLFLVTLPQYLVFVIFAVRFLGLDLKKFGFKQDDEYLDIKEEDREEFELNLTFDKENVVRRIKKFFRHVKYVYLEHRFLSNLLITLFVLGISLYCFYYFGVVLKVYHEGDKVAANHYEIEVLNSYLTQNDSNGDSILGQDDSSFVVVDLKVTNLGSDRVLNLDRFHLLNHNESFQHTTQYYASFVDLGSSYSGKTLVSSSSVRFLLVYQVKTDLEKDNYILYYQDVDDNLSLKKIQLSIRDVREIAVAQEYSLKEEAVFPTEDNLTITSSSLADFAVYSTYRCDDQGCSMREESVSLAPNKILTLTFISDTLDGNRFIDFLQRYAKMKYRNIENQEVIMDVSNALSRDYYGNRAYLRVPSDVSAEGISLIFTFRDKQYIYHLQ